ncbi:bifunctional glycosyltransferase/CDP-glycerol:glycerophosphate glycerophosphotransferase [Jeotgalibacillus marinus]|uniref:CDP-glycerol glycerophosphotransferase family protein n=1 Tax=Jeotgalibacillus marinus TaxID=86667 RepID=A0ABV3Q6A1_9BACL
MKMDISVIIPTYNVERFIEEALFSIVDQTFKGKVEIIIIDDCSTDNTLEIIEDFKKNHRDFPIQIFEQEKNMRQGTARNRGLRIAKGKYVFFVDGDDFLDLNTLETMFHKAEGMSCDFVVCDWAYYYEDRGLVYVNNDKFLFTDLLQEEKCESLLAATTYFSVNKLYNREFLLQNEIKYGEGYIYEDFEFYVEVAQKANKVGIVQNPYYRVRVNEFSTTKTDRKTMIHIESLIKSVENTVRKFEPRSNASFYQLYKYIIKKTMAYVKHRAPFGQKRKTVKRIVSILNKKSRDYPVPRKVVPLYYFYFKRKYVQNNKINRIFLIDMMHRKGYLEPLVSITSKFKHTLLKVKVMSNLNQKRLVRKKQKVIQQNANLQIDNKVILFLGFDYKYVGNSKYFFDFLSENNKKGYKCYFVTRNKKVPYPYRIAPRSLNFFKVLSQAKIVISESWVPLDFKKKEGQEWIQLWHGTPFKKLFFDSHERYISKFNINHKRNKQQDIAKWDYVLADSRVGKEKLSSAFAYEKDKILNYGYPRVQWLQDNQDNKDLKKDIKEKLGIQPNKKVILYVPTWRDYNYKQKNLDLDYLLDIESLGNGLQDEYVILNKQHSMGKFTTNDQFVITPDKHIEVQQLILISDVIISDYSSIIFDGMAIDIPFYLYINDFDKYQEARGVYEDIHEVLKPFYVEDKNELIEKIKTNNESYNNEQYKIAKKLLSNVNDMDSYNELQNKINAITNK